MEITKVELMILSKEFLTASNRILRANYAEYNSELTKFVRFLESRPPIYNYICACGEPEYNVESEVNEVCKSSGRSIFSLGSTDEKETANIFSIIKYLAEHNYNGHSYVFFGYSSSNKFQDKIDGFGDRVIRILINHIENHLTRIAYEMTTDERAIVNLKIENSNLTNTQVNLATDNASIVSTQDAVNTDELRKLIEDVLKNSEGLNDEDKQTVNECVDTIATLADEKPKKNIIKMALNTLKAVAGTAEFAAAVATIVQFVMQFI